MSISERANEAGRRRAELDDARDTLEADPRFTVWATEWFRDSREFDAMVEAAADGNWPT